MIEVVVWCVVVARVVTGLLVMHGQRSPVGFVRYERIRFGDCKLSVKGKVRSWVGLL